MFSKASGYAIRGLTYLAVHRADDRRIGIDELADALGAPRHFMAKVMQQLTRRQYLNSLRGPSGGFQANDKTLSLNLLEIVDTMEGMNFFTRCGLGIDQCSASSPCPLHEEIVRDRESIKVSLKSKTIAQVVEDMKKDEDITLI